MRGCRDVQSSVPVKHARRSDRAMNYEPRTEMRTAQPYAGIRMSVTMDSLPGAVDEGFPELFGWLADRGITVAGPPFIRYLLPTSASGTRASRRRRPGHRPRYGPSCRPP